MSNEKDLHEIELNIEVAKKFVATGKALERLTDNEDFITIIRNGYFKEEAARLVMLKAEPAMEDEGHQKAVTKAIDAIGSLFQYFRRLEVAGEQANVAIQENQATREEILEEDMQE